MPSFLRPDILSNTTTLVIGIANARSIAHSIAQYISDHGGKVIITYMDEMYKEKVKSVIEGMNVTGFFHYNAKDNDSCGKLVEQIMKVCPDGIDNVVHAIAWADKDQLRGRYCDTTLDNFLPAMQISCFSFTQLAHKLYSIMKTGGSMMTLSYYGAEKFVVNYNVMGVCKAALEASVRYLAVDMGKRDIRVNAISAGPIKTLAASGIKDFNELVDRTIQASPMKRTLSTQDVAGMALFLSIKELSACVTGQVLYVDCGFSAIGMPPDNKGE